MVIIQNKKIPSQDHISVKVSSGQFNSTLRKQGGNNRFVKVCCCACMMMNPFAFYTKFLAGARCDNLNVKSLCRVSCEKKLFLCAICKNMDYKVTHNGLAFA